MLALVEDLEALDPLEPREIRGPRVDPEDLVILELLEAQDKL